MGSLDNLIGREQLALTDVRRKYSDEMFLKKSARKIETWFLECKYNPKYKYCRKWVDEEYDNY